MNESKLQTAAHRGARLVKGDRIWPRYLKSLVKIRDGLKQDAEAGDADMAAALKLLEPLEKHLWAVADKRKLAEAQAKDKGVVLWEVFHPRTRTPLRCSAFDLRRHVVRRPNTVFVENEYWTIKDSPRVAARDRAYDDLRHELDALGQFDEAAFDQYAREIDEVLWRRRAKGLFGFGEEAA
ncbi:MAG TPA: hypothetical protein VG028_13380 [Terriglobia bacterium]|nr:hypothetical protein [Terriglobia bacterium]